MSIITTFNVEVNNELQEFRNDVFKPIYLGHNSLAKLLSVMRSVKKFYGTAYETVSFDTIKALINETLRVSMKCLDSYYDDAFKTSQAEQIGVTHLLKHHIKQLNNATNHQEYINALADMRSETTMYVDLKYINSKDTFLQHFADIAAKLEEAAKLDEAKKLEDAAKLDEAKKLEEAKQFKKDNERLKQENEKLMQTLAQQEETTVKLQQQLDSLKNSIANIVKSTQ